MIFVYYVIFCVIGIAALSAMIFGDGTGYVDGIAGPGFVGLAFIFAVFVAPVLALIMNAIISKMFKGRSMPIPLESDPQTISDEDKFDTINERILALTIDAMIVCIPLAAINIIHVQNGEVFLSSITEYLLYSVVLFFHYKYIPVFALYSIVSTLFFGKTIGKRVLKLEVVSANSTEKLSFKQVLLRNFLVLLLSVEHIANIVAAKLDVNQGSLGVFTYVHLLAAVLLIIDVIMAFQNKNNISLHDKISKTVCVRS